jgi:hypothetical protein
MSRFIVVLLVVLLVASFASPAYGGKPPRHPQGEDPCTGNCGNGDHGLGDPTNGSLHANEHAAQGEVDPVGDEPIADQDTIDSTDVPQPSDDVPQEPSDDAPQEPSGDAAQEPSQDIPAEIPTQEPVSENLVQEDVSTQCNVASCDICEELTEIKANQEIMIGLLNVIVELLEKILSALS